jgi:hypothetical protein
MNSIFHRVIATVVLIMGAPFPLANTVRGAVGPNGSQSKPAVAAEASRSNSPSPALDLRLGFAMADFTGDTHPDLATLELIRVDSSSAQYSIKIQLTEGGHQLLRVAAPFGGLLITSKDVTGDGIPDLVVRSARSRLPVAVFLNDGFGHFSATDLSAFAKVLGGTTSEREFTTKHFSVSATLVFPKSYSIRDSSGSARNSQLQNGSLISADSQHPFHQFLPFGLNRAPPVVA